jgi:hypothetical protein
MRRGATRSSSWCTAARRARGTTAWSYRWNSQVFAAAGYVVFMPNPRGSTGFGQQFTDEISGDWGGKVFDDLMKGARLRLARCPSSMGRGRAPPARRTAAT